MLQAQTAPEIEVRGNDVEILSGLARSSRANHTDFGGVYYYNGMSRRQFTIRNTGTASLNLTGTSLVAITGSTDFVVTSQPSAASISAGGNLTFDVTFDPVTYGFKRAQVVIASNDSDEASYQFEITGNAESNQDQYPYSDWSVPSGVTMITVEAWGGGGSGANGGAGGRGGGVGSGGGGGGAYARSTLAVVPGQVYGCLDGEGGDGWTVAHGEPSSFTRKSDNATLVKAVGGVSGNGGAGGQTNLCTGDFVFGGAAGSPGNGSPRGTGGGSSGGFIGTGGSGAGGGGGGSGGDGGSPGGGGGGGDGGYRSGGWGGDGSLRISYTYSRPDIDVQGNGVSIADQDTQPAVEDHTAFGGTSVGGSITRTFTIRNTGTVDLNLTGSPFVTVHPATHFKVTTQATTPVSSYNGSKTFVVTFMPTSAGLKQATVSIYNDDADEYLYTFAIEGTGTAPDLAVETEAGAALPAGTGTVAFDTVNTGSSKDLGFRIKNVGSANLASLTASLTGANASEFSLVGTVPSTLAAAADATLGVRFSPTSAGAKTATLQITSNDPDTPTYTVALTGTGFFGPEIGVFQGDALTGTALTDNQGSLDLGTVYAGQTGTTQTYTILNTGNDTLTGLNLQATGDPDFTNTLPAATTLAAGASTTFTITFAPGSDGSKAATFRLLSNDEDENPFRIRVTGTGKPNSAPVITNNNGVALLSWSLAETNRASLTLTATDADLPNQTLTFSVSGSDAGLFEIIQDIYGTQLVARQMFDFENPADVGADNVYNVTVTVTDNGVPAMSDTQELVITITNQNDLPVISAIPDQTLPVNGNTGPVPFTVTDIEIGAAGRILTPAGAERTLTMGTAIFGPTMFDVTAEVVMADPPLADSPLINAAQCVGKIVMVDRGAVSFPVKVANAQAAGAVGVIVVNNVVTTAPPSLGGADPTIVIPVASVTNAAGATLKSLIPSTLTMNLLRGQVSVPPTVTATSDNLDLVSQAGIVLGSGATASDYTITVTPEAGQSGIAVITVSAFDGLGTSVRRFLVMVTPADQVPVIAFTETFENAGGFDRPGWLKATLEGATSWQQTASRYCSASHSWQSPDAGAVSSRVLISPQIAVSAATELSFYHTFAFETGHGYNYDGGRLEYTVDGSTWQSVPDSAFVQGGHNGTVHPISITNVLSGQKAWVGGSLGEMTEVVVDLGSFAHGEMVRLRWHAAEDVALGVGGWFVDDVTVRVPDIAVAGLAGIEDGDVAPSTAKGTDFGSRPVNAVNPAQTFTISNTGGVGLTLTGAAPVTLTGDAGDFVVTQPATTTVASGASVTFTIAFKPTSLGGKNAVVSVASDDADESPYTFAITGIAIDPKPEPVRSMAGQDVVTQGGAPGVTGSAEIAKFDVLRRGGFLAENGHLVFPGFLEVGSGDPAVTAETRSGVWKAAGSNLFMMARTGTTVPEVPGAQFATLPEVPGISEEGEASLLATLVIGSGGVIASNDTGLWSELGGSGLHLLMREDDTVPGVTPVVKVGSFASGLYATATTGMDSGEAAFSVTYRGGSTSSALLRASVNGDDIVISEIAREGMQGPGITAGINFSNLFGSYSDPGRMDAQGNFVFSALTTPGSKEGIWYQPVTGGTATKVVFSGESAPGTRGTTFSKLYRPSMGGNSYITFRAAVSATGDNATNTRNDGIWAGFANNPSSITSILRRGDGSSVVPNLPAGSLVGNVWGGWLTNSNRGAWKAWLDVDGNTTSAAPTDKHAIYSTLSGAMRLELKGGDAAPGTTGATFSTFDLPVVGGDNQYAFLGTLTGGDVVGTTNNEGVWKSTANGAALKLMLRKGDTMQTSKGPKIVQKIDLPGAGGTDRRWEQPVMDATGRLVIFITFDDGSSSQILVP